MVSVGSDDGQEELLAAANAVINPCKSLSEYLLHISLPN